MKSRRMASLQTSLEIHRKAVERLVAAVNAVPIDRWGAPYREGNWSPGEISAHLVAVWDVVLAELGGSPGMAIRTRWWQRVVLRLTIVPRILAGGAFPKARAPRETRPAQPISDSYQAERAIRERAADFERQSEAAAATGRQITHAYFGKAPVSDGALLVARHIEHHAAQIEEAASRGRGAGPADR